MATRPPIVQSVESITVFVDGLPETINKDHTNFERVQQAIRDEAWDMLVPLMNIPKGMIQFSDGNVQIVDDEFFFRGIQVTDYLVERIMEMFHDQMPIGPMVAYFENLMLNPNAEARKDQFKWLEKGNMPITDDGYIIAYKYVNTDYQSCHSGVWEERHGEWHLNEAEKYDHTIGTVVEMPREKCDDNPNTTCSTGLHFCSFSYLGSGYNKSQRIVMVKVNPRDITAIPNDYNHAKARCCRYEVIGEIDIQEHGDVLAGKKVVRGVKHVATLDDLIFNEEPADMVVPAAEHSVMVADEMFEEDADDARTDALLEEDTPDHLAWSVCLPDEDEDDDEDDETESASVEMIFERGDDVFTETEVLALLTKYGSQGAVARETGIPRSTFGGWLNKISEAREAQSEVKLSFFHEGTNSTYTAQQVLDLLAAHGSQGAVERNVGIPRSTLRGWLSKIEAATD